MELSYGLMMIEADEWRTKLSDGVATAELLAGVPWQRREAGVEASIGRSLARLVERAREGSASREGGRAIARILCAREARV